MIFSLIIEAAVIWCVFAVVVSTLAVSIGYLLGEFKEFESDLRACVVEGRCQAGDSRTHLQGEKLLWELMQQYGTFVDVFHTWCLLIIAVFVFPCLFLFEKVDQRMNTTFLGSFLEALSFTVLIFIALPLSVERTIKTIKIVRGKEY